MGFAIKVRVKGISKAVRQLRKIEDIDYRAIHEVLGEHVVTITMRHFKEQRDPKGRPWKPLSKVTIKQRQKLRSGHRRHNPLIHILIDTGRLRRSITYRAGHSKAIIGPIGTNVVYARIHQVGGYAGRQHKVKIPARPYLGLSNKDLDDLAQDVKRIVKEYIKE